MIVLAQLPIAKLAEGHRRMQALALMGGLWAAAMLLIAGLLILVLLPAALAANGR